MGNSVKVPLKINRIISLVPSQTELLVDLGLRDQLVGVTKFCVHPEGLFETVERIGGTKTIKIQRIIDLQPDLVIGNKEENSQSDIEALYPNCSVWMSDITDVPSALDMLLSIGDITNKVTEAKLLHDEISAQFQKLDAYKTDSTKNALYLIWRKPYMAAGKGTFIDDCLQRIGLENVLKIDRYPEVDLSSISPDFILLSSEPYPFSNQHIAELQIVYPDSKIVLVDGEFFSWYGSRMNLAVDYFLGLKNELGL